MNIEQIKELIAKDIAAMDDLIKVRLQSEVVLVNQLSAYIINSGGKRVRPVIHLLAARACGYSGPHHSQVAAIIEFIHTATLLHDDVVDASQLRRGQETANALFGNEASVLVGDFLYSRSFEMMVEINNMRVMELLAHATNVIAEGEVMQLLNIHDAEITEEHYLEVIRCKTAKLFQAATQLGAVISGSSKDQEEAMRRYGMHLGTAFQLIDDVLDYSSTSAELGKEIGDDLAEGKPTLPLIYAMQRGTAEEAETIRKAIETGGRELIEPILRAIDSTGAMTYTADRARAEADQAKRCLEEIPASPFRDAMASLSDFAVQRNN